MNFGRPYHTHAGWMHNGRLITPWVAIAISEGHHPENESKPMARIYTIERFKSGKDAVIGRLRDPEGNFICHTLEDEHRVEKVWGETCIWADEYALAARFHGSFYKRYGERWPWHDFIIEIMNVRDFTDILMHVGNDDDDTAGCVLLGIWRGADNFIGDSRKTYEKAWRAMRDDVAAGTARLRIYNNDGWQA